MSSSNTLTPAYEAAHAPMPDRLSLRWDPAANRKVAFGLLTVGVLGVVATLLGIGYVEPHTGWGLYLQAYLLFLQLALGSLFFVIVHHLTGSRWGVTVRRVAEASMATLPVFALLFLPLALFPRHVWEWTDVTVLAGDKALQAKQAYLNLPFFYARAVTYFAVWTVLSQFFWRRSIQQDAGRDVMGSLKAVSAPGLLLFALSLTFAAFDWIMSLDPHWYSTIFGVYYYAGGTQGMFAMLVLAALLLQRSGMLKNAVTVEHYHDLGKFAFGFTIFFAYIAFSQFLLIWYANIPEETEFYLRRWGPWAVLSMALLFVSFVLPLLVLMSRKAKRTMNILATGAVLILIGRAIDMYWLVMPSFAGDQGPVLSWIYVTAMVGVGGVYLGTFALLLGRHALIPLGDPLLKSSLGHENV
jgi:hypothetical protein